MAPLPRNQRCHSQKPVLLPFLVYSFFAECGSKSTLMFGGAGGCAQGPVHCCWLYTCLGLLVAVKVQPRSTGILASFGFGAVGLHAFCLPSLRTLHIYIYIYIYIYIILYIQGGATSTTLAHAAESGPFSVPHECLRWATNLSCRNGSNKAERYMQKAPAETKAMKCNQRQRERSHTIILPHAPLNQCCFSQTGDLLASKYSTASLPRIQVQ